MLFRSCVSFWMMVRSLPFLTTDTFLCSINLMEEEEDSQIRCPDPKTSPLHEIGQVHYCRAEELVTCLTSYAKRTIIAVLFD